ncbi:hypothetical protein LPC10_17795 [Methylorubrum sp. B1-46]|uniref:hypothetical protein n=1 Tax=Methylorubrum TaxID=2282523 RepID=UPI001E4D98E5|nr:MULTISPECIES: hypothetical protein [Methylorubrum]MCG5246854.1 hypothetical protein [Methylorubrum extorquens]UGB24784.1 hypothetical protein LPC10_17795 [Methylorubrum sp. B1-46]
MAKKPDFVVTGVHIPKVHFWARVLVTPERLQQVTDLALRQGQVFLNPGEVLQIDTRIGDDSAPAETIRTFTIRDYEADTPCATCLVAWNGTAGDITMYGDDADILACLASSANGLFSGATRMVEDDGFALNSDLLSSIKVGDVQVFFPRKAREEPEDEPAENDPDLYPSRLSAGGNLRAPRGVKVADYGRGAV